MTVAEQARAFLAMALCGAALGAADDVLALFRRGAALTALADIGLGLLAAAGVIAAALVLQCEAFRLYVLLGVACGFALYRASLGTIVRFLAKRIGKLSKKVAN